MKITWLGQAGLLFESDGCRVIIDPYLSNSLETVNSFLKRRQHIDTAFLRIQPDVLILTHEHGDHYDPETINHYLNREQGVLVLAPFSVWKKIRRSDSNNYVCFDRHSVWSHCGMKFTAVRATHSDPYAIGVIVESRGNKYYVTGDTLYNTEIFPDIPDCIHALFLPINGTGNNMNVDDAAAFASRVCPHNVVPIHYGMFDEIDPHTLCCPNRLLLNLYEEIEL